jgi:hypothetical protein
VEADFHRKGVRGVKGVTFLGVVEGLPEATAWPAAPPPPSLILISLEELDLLQEKHSQIVGTPKRKKNKKKKPLAL